MSAGAGSRYAVAIVGGGPTGLMTSILLSRCGVRSILFEKHAQPLRFPKGRGITARTMEIFREIGIEDEVRSRALDPEDSRHFYQGSTLLGTDFSRRRGTIPATPGGCAGAVCSQDLLEPILLDVARKHPLATIVTESEVVRVQAIESESGRTAIRYRRAGDGCEGEISAEYVVGADGSSSLVRELLGIRMLGSAKFAESVSILFECDLGEPLVDRRSLRYRIRNPRVDGTVVAVDNAYRWLLMTEAGFLAGQPNAERACLDLVRATLGAPVDVTLLGYRVWQPAARVAEAFSRQNVFLVGDAAHVSLPAGGLGLNCGIQDAYNLAWKLQLALDGRAGPRLLESYETERRPIDQESVRESVRQAVAGRRPIPPQLSYSYVYRSDVIADDHGNAGGSVPDLELGDGCSLHGLLGYEFALLCWERDPALDPLSGFLDANVVELSGYRDGCSVLETLGLRRSGAMLVRPDKHVAWSTDDGSTLDETEARRLVNRVTGHVSAPALRLGGKLI